MEIAIQENSKYGLVVSSRIIAKELGKQHKHILETLDKILESRDFGSLIIPSIYKAEGQKRNYREYLLTKDGFTLYMFNIQGYQDFKMAYISKFNEMEKKLQRKEQLAISFQSDDFEKDIVQLKAKANAMKREILERRFILDEKLQILEKTGLTNHMDVYRANGKIYVCQDV